MDFASLKFRDVFTEISTGLPPQICAAGSSVGSAISMIGCRKLVFHAYLGSASATCSIGMSLFTASVSTGTGSTFLASASIPILSWNAVSTAPGPAVMDVRGEYLENNSAKGPWVFPVLSLSGASADLFVQCFGYLRSYGPASNYDTASFVASETILY